MHIHSTHFIMCNVKISFRVIYLHIGFQDLAFLSCCANVLTIFCGQNVLLVKTSTLPLVKKMWLQVNIGMQSVEI